MPTQNDNPLAGAHILLVEDESSLRKGVRFNLEAEGARVTDYSTADSALAALQSGEVRFHLGVLDIMTPGFLDGIQLCAELRARGYDFPVIFLTARAALEDKLAGFRAGADDYLAKPFDLEELLARAAARLRRPAATRSEHAATTQIGACTLDLRAGSARRAGDPEIVRFNERELEILKLLVANRGRPVTRDEILDHAWGSAEFPTNRSVDNYLVKFRKIFEDDPQKPRWFITRHGIGYELCAADAPDKS